MKLDFDYVDKIELKPVETIKTRNEKTFYVRTVVITTNREYYTLVLKSMDKSSLDFLTPSILSMNSKVKSKSKSIK